MRQVEFVFIHKIKLTVSNFSTLELHKQKFMTFWSIKFLFYVVASSIVQRQKQSRKKQMMKKFSSFFVLF